MSKEMIVSVNGREKKIAILDNGKVTEFYIERGEENSGVVGNVYKGRVMRVLPGMQSAFVDIGLERDAFLYVSDFFDEDEEIERVVMEKNKKGSPEDAKREANEQIDRSRIEREKQMESVQELAEPLAETGVDVVIDASDEPEAETECEPEKGRRGRGRGRGRGREDRDEQPRREEMQPAEPIFEIEYDNSGFERISDDEESTGEMFKDAYMQEAIQHKVRTIEFDMESTEVAEVGSLLDAVTAASSSFERIADEDDEAPAAPAKGRGKSKAKPKAKAAKSADAPAEEPAAEADETVEAESGAKEEKPAAKRRSPAKRGAAAKGKFTKPKAKKKSAGDALEDAEASEKDSGDTAEMAVRRGGRGRRRGGKAKTDENGELLPDAIEDVDGNVDDTVETAEAVDAAVETAPEEAAPQQAEPGEERERPGDERGGRESRNKRGGRGRDRERQSSDRPSGDRPAGDRPERAERSDRNDRGGRGRNDRNDRGGRPQPLIADLLREGQEILVQIAKEPIAKKGARITSHIALPGRYLVYMPTIEHLGVSRKIESSSERGRLRTLIQRIRQDAEIPAGGFIVRTAGIGISEEDLRNDAKYLARMWAESKKNSEKKRSPSIVHQDLDLVQRILRDQFSDDFTAIRVDSEEEYLRTVEFINLIQPRSVNKVKLYTRDEPILEYYGVQEEIDKALKPRVWLKSGGYLVINQTEALVAIDVNTGKFVGKGNARLEDTITRTNMEAVDEIARQIRLRDLGGIIVLDLIDMDDRRNRHKVSQALQEALSTDRSPTKVLSFNDFGLIIMTRKRVKQSLERTMCSPCDYCEGSGWVKSPTTVCYEILAEARRLSKNVEDVRHTTLRVHPDVAKSLRSTEREVLEEIEAYLGHIDVTSDKSIHQGQFDFAFV